MSVTAIITHPHPALSHRERVWNCVEKFTYHSSANLEG